MIFIHKRFAIPPFFRKKLALSIVKVFRNIHFLPHFPFLLPVSEVPNISNKFCLLNKSAKETFLHKTPYTLPLFQTQFGLSIAGAFRNIHLLPHLYEFSRRMRYAIFQISTDLLAIYEHNFITFLHLKKSWRSSLWAFLEISTFY